MKGQAQIIAAGAVVTVVVVMTLLGLTIYGLVSDVYPHQQSVTNETMCTTCVNNTEYAFDLPPILNDTTLICFNSSSDLMVNGETGQTCLGYNIVGLSIFNFTNSTAGDFCQIENITCSYTFDESNDLEEAFYGSSTNITFSGFTLLSIAGIILAAVAIVMLILFLKG